MSRARSSRPSHLSASKDQLAKGKGPTQEAFGISVLEKRLLKELAEGNIWAGNSAVMQLRSSEPWAEFQSSSPTRLQVNSTTLCDMPSRLSKSIEKATESSSRDRSRTYPRRQRVWVIAHAWLRLSKDRRNMQSNSNHPPSMEEGPCRDVYRPQGQIFLNTSYSFATLAEA